MNFIPRFLLIALLPLLLTNCASKKELVELQRAAQDYRSTIAANEHQNRTLKLHNRALEAENDSLQQQEEALAKQLIAARSALIAARNSLTELSNQEAECPEEWKNGIVFRVQIGAFEERSLSENITSSVNLDTEQKNDMQKITVGQFRAYDKADRLKTHLRAMGVEDAWIVSYLNDERIDIQTALSLMEEQLQDIDE